MLWFFLTLFFFVFLYDSARSKIFDLLLVLFITLFGFTAIMKILSRIMARMYLIHNNQVLHRWGIKYDKALFFEILNGIINHSSNFKD